MSEQRSTARTTDGHDLARFERELDRRRTARALAETSAHMRSRHGQGGPSDCPCEDCHPKREPLMPGDQFRPAIETLGDLRNLRTRTADLPHGTDLYVRMVDDQGRERGDTRILRVDQDPDGAIRLTIVRY